MSINPARLGPIGTGKRRVRVADLPPTCRQGEKRLDVGGDA
jgi:hypothetical protein